MLLKNGLNFRHFTGIKLSREKLFAIAEFPAPKTMVDEESANIRGLKGMTTQSGFSKRFYLPRMIRRPLVHTQLWSMFTWCHSGHVGGVNKETVAMLEEWNILLGIELYFYANSSFCLIMQIWLLVTWTNTLYSTGTRVFCFGLFQSVLRPLRWTRVFHRLPRMSKFVEMARLLRESTRKPTHLH